MFADVAPPAEEYQKVEYTEYKNAQVMSPPDMPDYMLDYTIVKAWARLPPLFPAALPFVN
ncbi:hypothetical protein ACSSS7_001640 [Eimeria intestinalis]